MLNIIIVKELLVSLKTVRFTIAVLICCLLMPLSVWVLSTDFLRDAEDYQGRVAMETRRTEGTTMQTNVNRPIPPLSALYRGVYPESVNNVTLKFYVGWNMPAAATTQSMANDLFPTVDLTFIIGIILSAMALMFSFDAFSGEKKEATLRLMMSNPVPRSRVVIGKWIGLSTALLIPFIVGFLLSLLIFFSVTGVGFDGNEWGALLLTVLAAVIYLSLFILIGMVISAFTVSPTVSILVCLGVWGLLTIVMPQTANAAADMIVPVPTPQAVEKNLRITYNDFANSIRDKNREIYDRAIREKMSRGQVGDLHDRVELMGAVQNRLDADQLEREFWLKVERQEAVGRTAALLSPYGCFSQAIISLANTGPESQRQFLRRAYSYGEEYFTYIWTRALNEADTTSAQAQKSAPKFAYQDPTLAFRLENTLIPLAVMFGLGLLLLFVAVIAFNRYDVR